MTVLMWFGLLCSCLFMMICLESMLAFKISKKRTIIFIVVVGVSSILMSVLLVALGVDIGQNIWHYYIYLGMFMTVLSSFQYKSLVKGLILGFGAYDNRYICGLQGR